MKKLIFSLLLLVLVAAGCNTNRQASNQGRNQTQPQTEQNAAGDSNQNLDQSLLGTWQSYPERINGWKTYSDPTHGFSFQYPSDWETGNDTPNFNAPLVSFVSPFCKSIGGSCYNGKDLIVTYFPTVDTYVKQYEYSGGPVYKNLGDLMQDQNAEVHGTGEIEVDGQSAYKVSIGGFGENDGIVMQHGNEIFELSFPNVLNGIQPYTNQKTNIIELLISTWKFSK